MASMNAFRDMLAQHLFNRSWIIRDWGNIIVYVLF
jgi:hypothetical protein